MYARSTTFHADPGAIDAGIAYARDEALPALTAMEGCLGLSMVVDRGTGRCIATSSWTTREAMDASQAASATYRSRGGEILGAAPEIDEWEVALMHRDHPTHDGACCRITWGRPPDLDAMVDMFRSTVLPRVEAMEGFCSASLFLDRDRGRHCGTVTFDSRAALDASRDGARELRETSGRRAGIEFLDIAEFDLALAHLRVPELV